MKAAWPPTTTSLLPSTPVSRLLVARGTPKTRLYQEHLAQRAPDLSAQSLKKRDKIKIGRAVTVVLST
jgi:hypothetical protein